jgi:hypothetical protein
MSTRINIAAIAAFLTVVAGSGIASANDSHVRRDSGIAQTQRQVARLPANAYGSAVAPRYVGAPQPLVVPEAGAQGIDRQLTGRF